MLPRRRDVTLSSGHRIATYLAQPAKPRPGKVLLLLNGGPGLPCDYLLTPHLRLVEDGWTVASYDQLGCGESDKPEDTALWTLGRYVAECEEVVGLMGLERFHLLGHSWGTWLGTEFALRNQGRIDKYVFADGDCDTPHLVEQLERLRAALGADTVAMMKRREAEGTIDHPEYQAAITLLNYRHVCRLDAWPEPLTRSLAQWNMGPYVTIQGPNEFTYTGNIRDWSLIPKLGELRIPCLVFCGEFDELPAACSARIHDALPDSRLKIFAGCSHMPFYEDPQSYFPFLRRFLEG
ncbi:MAG TPA: proline iminopeptidase-family hydrolase [Usitatibacter sp.]|nr:proline iminopeptidase-family hydrolase [Usitatibacter sp.]